MRIMCSKAEMRQIAFNGVTIWRKKHWKNSNNLMASLLVKWNEREIKKDAQKYIAI